MSRRQNPSEFLKQIIGKPVVVKLNSGVDYRGILACLDGFMNIALEQTEEYNNGQLQNKYGDAFIRETETLGSLLKYCAILQAMSHLIVMLPILIKRSVVSLHQKYLYPVTFSEDGQRRLTPSRCETSASTTNGSSDFICSTTQSPCTSSASGPNEVASTEPSLSAGHENDEPTSIWGAKAKTQLNVPSASTCDGSTYSGEINSSGTYVSSDGDFNEDALAEVICEQLNEMGIDTSSLADDELIEQMSGAVQNMKKQGFSRLYQPTFPSDLMRNLDVEPIKRRLKVISIELAHAVAVMRTNCDVDTMLEAMRGGQVVEPPVKRLKLNEVKIEAKKRVEALLKKLLDERAAARESTASEAAAPVPAVDDTAWFDTEDGPISNTAAPPSNSHSSSAEEERLNAFIRSKVEKHVVGSAARKHAYRSKKQQELSQRPQSQSQHQAGPEAPNQSSLSVQDLPTSSHTFSEADGVLSFDSPYLEDSFVDESSIDFSDKKSSDIQEQNHVLPELSTLQYDPISNPIDEDHLDDHLDFGLFDEFECAASGRPSLDQLRDQIWHLLRCGCMAGEFDYEVSRKLWEAAVPIEFQVDRDDESGDTCRPSYTMLPRCGYLPIHLTKILEQVKARDESLKLDADKVWLECNGLPLKVYYPIGVLFDLYKPIDAPTMTIIIKTGPRPDGVLSVSKDAMESMFMQSLKEANYLKRRRDEANSYMADEHKQLWSSLVHDRFDDFWSVNRRLMETTEERPFCDIPIRLYITEQPFRQILQPPFDSNGEPRTLTQALDSLSHDLVENGKYRFISHGITVPLETPLNYLGKNFAYPDNFVHISDFSQIA
ncbi:unnamed protein product [Cylicocyclus nassatus]|uniref:Autophagy protein 5 n=1 Tax=Cylicocyclus nassatus TaxID=53992 RepID=A0AA36GIF9_CYLNA|nr:unnamed protein product [Cylicocyclus nassatus]